MKKKIWYLSLGVVLLTVLCFVIFGSQEKEEKSPYDYRTEINTSNSESDGNSYWFVVWDVKNSTTQVNNFIMQEHEGFSMKEFKEEYGDNIFLVNLVQVSKKTYDINNE